MRHTLISTQSTSLLGSRKIRDGDFPGLPAVLTTVSEMKGKGGGEKWQKQPKSRHSVCRGLKRVGLLSQSGNGWNCVCRTAYKSQCWQYLSMSQTILLGDGSGEMRINSLLLLPSAPVRSFHPKPTPQCKATCDERLINIKQVGSRLPLPSAFRHNYWGHFNVFCPDLKGARLSRLPLAEIPSKDVGRWSMCVSFEAPPVHRYYFRAHQV